MGKRRGIAIFFLIFPFLTAQADKLHLVTELTPSGYQKDHFLSDGKHSDFLFRQDQSFWVLSDTSLWQWKPLTKNLRRLRILKPKDQSSRLVSLATDGINLFSSTNDTIFQINTSEHRIFRYPKIKNNQAFSPFFVGFGDDFWWVGKEKLFRLDRYGKTLEDFGSSVFLKNSRQLIYSREHKELFWILGNKIYKKTPTAGAEVEHLLTTKQVLIGIQSYDKEIFAHTTKTVLRISSKGKILQSIPVEGRRSLLTMQLDHKYHAYLFSDHILEVYDLTAKKMAHYRLPLEKEDRVTKIALSWPLLAISQSGELRLFHLGDEALDDPV